MSGVIDKQESLSTEEFKRQFQTKRTPVILSKSFNWDALSIWDFPYFKKKYADKTVQLDFYSEVENHSWGVRTVKLPEALDLISNNTNKKVKHYLMQKSISEEFPELLSDIQLPKYANTQIDYFINLWIGEAGIISQAHYDCSDNFLTQIVGRKRVRLFPPTESMNMYSYRVDEDYLGDKSASHISRIQDSDFVMGDFPNFKNVTCFEEILSPGDILYIPAGWWHEIKSLDTSISVNFWWKMKLFDLSAIQARDWIVSTFFYFSNDRFEEIINTIFDFSGYSDHIKVAEDALSKNLLCIAAVFLLHQCNKTIKIHQESNNPVLKNELSKWQDYLSVAKKNDDALLNRDILSDIISKIREQQ